MQPDNPERRRDDRRFRYLGNELDRINQTLDQHARELDVVKAAVAETHHSLFGIDGQGGLLRQLATNQQAARDVWTLRILATGVAVNLLATIITLLTR